MTITKEYLVDLEEKYIKVGKLINEDSKFDPVTEPYLSKYSARQILMGMKANVEYLLRSHVPNTPEHIRFSAMLATIYIYLGTICIETEELSAGKKHLEKSLELTEPYQMKPQFIVVTMNANNQMGILWSLKEPEKAKVYLESAETFYKKYKNSATPPVPLDSLFNANFELCEESEAWSRFEKVHTFTLYYLAQIYGALRDTLKSSLYCHNTLKRQLVYKEYDSIDWALNAATLAQFFMEKNGFKQARHHLSASSYVLAQYQKELDAVTEQNELFAAKMETFRHRSADVARCWAKYGSNLLAKSKERLLNHTDDEKDQRCTLSSDLAQLKLTPDTTVALEDLQHLYFPSLNLVAYEVQIIDTFILTLEEARLVFLNAQNWLNEAELYYSLESLASDYIEITFERSQLYLNLLFFEDNPENQAKLHKRRINSLENVADKVNPKYYLQYCRQMWFELGQTYLELLDIKLDIQRESKDRPTPKALLKINSLVEKAVAFHNKFIESFMDNGQIVNLNEDMQKPFVKSHFYIAALHGKYITLDKKIKLHYTESSLNSYNKVIEFCKDHPKMSELIPMELGICKEMANLLPLKIKKLKTEIP